MFSYGINVVKSLVNVTLCQSRLQVASCLVAVHHQIPVLNVLAGGLIEELSPSLIPASMSFRGIVCYLVAFFLQIRPPRMMIRRLAAKAGKLLLYLENFLVPNILEYSKNLSGVWHSVNSKFFFLNGHL